MNTPKCPDLVVGDPQIETASFTRFVLPFSYELKKESVGREELHYREAGDSDWMCGLRPESGPSQSGKTGNLERRDYLTPETSQAIHERTRWFVLSSALSEASPLLGTNPLGARARAGLVLMESKAPKTHGVLHTGFLMVETFFDSQRPITYEAFLTFNERFRYYKRPYPGHECGGYARRKKAENDRETESRPYLARWASLLEYPVRLDGHFYEFVSLETRDTTAAYAEGRSDKPGWFVSSDNRAYVWTCAVLPNGTDASLFSPTNGAWIKLLNADGPGDETPPADASAFEKEWAAKRTYIRWMHTRSLYGYCAHAGAVLTVGPNQVPVWQHFRQIYFDQALLQLYARASLLRFGKELADLSTRCAQSPKKFASKFGALRWQLSYFANLYLYPMASNQQQAQEMYPLLRSSLEVDDLFQKLEKQIEQGYNYTDGLLQSERNETSTILSWIGWPLAYVGLCLSYIQTVGGARPLHWGEYAAASFLFVVCSLFLRRIREQVLRFLRWLWKNERAS